MLHIQLQNGLPSLSISGDLSSLAFNPVEPIRGTTGACEARATSSSATGFFSLILSETGQPWVSGQIIRQVPNYPNGGGAVGWPKAPPRGILMLSSVSLVGVTRIGTVGF